MLGWYIPGLSELPLGNRLLLLPFSAILCFLHFSWHFQSFFPFFFVRFVCVRVLRIRQCGRARHRRGCQRVVAGREGFARSAVAVLVARRRVCLETRGKHEWALSGLLMWSRLYYVRVDKGRCVIRKITFKRCLFLRRNLKSMRERRILSTKFGELANEGHGEHRASREAGDGAHCGREGGKLYLDRIGCEMVARGAGGVRG